MPTQTTLGAKRRAATATTALTRNQHRSQYRSSVFDAKFMSIRHPDCTVDSKRKVVVFFQITAFDRYDEILYLVEKSI